MGNKGLKVLVVDDNSSLVRIMQGVLRQADFTVLSATNGVEGLKIAQTESPDIIVSDIGMPFMNGREMLQRLRSNPATSAIPVILMTGRPDQVTLRDGMQLGADDYLPKPIKPTDLLAAITMRLKRRDEYRQIANSDGLSYLPSSLPHELLTPLTGIIGSADLLLMDHGHMAWTDLDDIYVGIRQSGYRLLHLVQNYLLLNQLDSISSQGWDRRKFCEGFTPSAGVVIEAASRRRAENWAPLGDLQLDLGEAPLAIREELVSKAVEEIVDNAFKFSAAGSDVVISSQIDNDLYLVRVADSGRGMTPKEIAAVGAYRQFNRATYEQQGIGIGLELSRRIVEYSGGSLRIQSRPGSETVVSSTWPMASGSFDRTTTIEPEF